MRFARRLVTAVAATALVAMAFSLAAPLAKAQDFTRLFREGQVLAVSSTEITIQEDGTGKQTYSLGPTELSALSANGIVVGDRIRYTVHGDSGYVSDFEKLSK